MTGKRVCSKGTDGQSEIRNTTCESTDSGIEEKFTLDQDNTGK